MAAISVMVTEFSLAAEVVLTLIEGESGLSTSGLSNESIFELNAALEAMRRRYRLLNSVLQALQDLDMDGYPKIPPRFVDDSLIAEIRAHIAAMQAALAQFKTQVEGTVTFGEPVPK